jgi:hypothetical protein
MNTKNNQNVLAIVASIAIIAAISSIGSVTDIFAHTPTIFQYGTIGQEDEDYAIHDGAVYLNAVYEDHSGNFRYAMPAEFTVNEALDRFYPSIQEDTHSFTVEKDWNSLGMIYMFNDETLTFQFIGVTQ